MREWTRVGKGGLTRVALIVLALSAVIALFIAAPMSQLGELVSGTSLPFWLGYLGGVVVVFVLIAPLVLPRATRPLSIDPSRTALRVGGSTTQASQIRHAYRVPDGQFDGRFQLQFSVPGVDPLVAVSSALPSELPSDELDALIALIANAPIEPDPRVPLRPPIADELGTRDDARRFDDELGEVLMPFERMSYARPTLLVELQAVRDALVDNNARAGSSTIRDLGLVAPGATNAPERRRALRAAAPQSGSARGFWATQGAEYRAQIAEVERWLGTEGVPTGVPRGWRWWIGLLLVIIGFASPWLSGIIAFPVVFATSSAIGFPTMMGIFVFFLLTWPFIVWPGVVLIWSARIERYRAARGGALAVRRRRGEIPESVEKFFGPQFPEIAFLNPLLWLLLVESIVLLVGGLTAITMGAGQVENWEALPLGLPVGVTMVIASAPLFAWAVRLIRDGAVKQVRADVFWRAISSQPR